VLLTDDGELTNLLTHPRYEHDKEYHVYVTGRPNEAALARWRRGVRLSDCDAQTHDGGRTAPAHVEIMHLKGQARSKAEGTWLRVIMREGRKRQIRRIASMLGHPVQRIIRVRIGTLRLGNLKPGQWRYVTDQELADLRSEISQHKPRYSKAMTDTT